MPPLRGEDKGYNDFAAFGQLPRLRAQKFLILFFSKSRGWPRIQVGVQLPSQQTPKPSLALPILILLPSLGRHYESNLVV